MSSDAPDPRKITRPILEDDLEPLELERMKALPIFAGIAESTLKKLQPNILVANYEPGQVILREGDYSDAAYYILSGAVQVMVTQLPTPGLDSSTTNADTGAGAKGVRAMAERMDKLAAKAPQDRAFGHPESAEKTIILTDLPVDIVAGQRVLLETGELFGELSALSRYPVSATVRAELATECVLIRTPALRMMQRTSKSFKEYVEKRYRQRSLKAHLSSVSLFVDCDKGFIADLAKEVELLSFEPGQVIVEQGTPGDAFFLVRGGYVKVSVRVGANDLAVTYLRKGDYAGEAALLLDEPWPFGLSALEHVEIVKLSREAFKKVLKSVPEVEPILWDETFRRLKERGRVSRDPISAEYLQMAMETGLIHGESVLLIDLETCTRCDDCVRGCAETHGGSPRFIREGLKYKNWLIPTSCYECTDPVCMIGCPTGAITRPVGTKEVVIDEGTCIGCHNCVRRCPWENIVELPAYPSKAPGLSEKAKKEGIDLATKCDQCIGRKEGPACVQMCPHGSAVRISFKDFVTVAETLK